MAEIINLRRARKKKARAAREIEADSNRARHGVPTSGRKLERVRREKAMRDLESLRLSEDEKK
jgi:hypothetical protein